MNGLAWWTSFGWTMIHFTWVASLLGLAALLIRPSLRGLAPQVRYVFALGVLVAVSVSPVVIFFVLCDAGGDAGPVVAKRAPITAAVRAASDPVVPVTGAVVSDRAGPVMAASEETAGVDRLVAVLPALWLLGACLAFARLGAGAAGARRLRSRSSPVTDPGLLSLLDRLHQGLGVSRRVALAVNDRVVSPLVIGTLRPLIVLPPSLVTGWTPEAVEMALIHELGHVLRHDNIVSLFQRVAEALLFFHPVVWLLSREVRREREHCCDALVVARTGEPRAYAATLLSLATPSRRLPLAATAMAEHDLVERVRHILEKESVMTSRSQRYAGIVGAVLCLGALSLSVFGQWAERAPAESLRAAQEEKATTADPFQAWHPPLLAPQEEGLCPRAKTGTSCTNCHKVKPDTPSPHGLDPAHLALGACTNCHLPAAMVTAFAPFHHQESRRRWGPEQATGAPDTPHVGDLWTAWASLTEDDQREWLDLAWKKPVRAQAIQVYESFNPGAVDRLTIRTSAGKVHEVAVANVGKADTGTVRVLSIPLQIDGAVKSVRLHLDSPAVKGWNEIDAVGLIDIAGESHWATTAKASSTYASRYVTGVLERTVSGGRIVDPHRVDPRLLPDPVQVQRDDDETDILRRRLAETRLRLEEALKRLEKLEKELGRRDGTRKRDSIYEPDPTRAAGEYLKALRFYERAAKPVGSKEGEESRYYRNDDVGKKGDLLSGYHSPPVAGRKPVSGTVISVQKDQITASFGSSSGVKRGHFLDVIRGNTYLGRLRVDDLKRDRCIGKLVLKAGDKPIRPGDVVTNTLR